MSEISGTGEGAQARFAALVDAPGNQPGVTHGRPGSKLFGHSALKVHDKIFAVIASSGHFVVKLPKARVDELVARVPASASKRVKDGR